MNRHTMTALIGQIRIPRTILHGGMTVAVLMGVLSTTPTQAQAAGIQTADTGRGETIYLKRCVWCHGEDGDGFGPAGKLLVPPPRDFTAGLYKIKTSPFSEDFANDADIYRMIRDGMPGTDMPGWSDRLSEQDMWDLVVYLKAFAELEEEPGTVVDYGTQVASSPESIARGKELFAENDRCTECHGKDGKGDGIKKLKGDAGERTWPRNLTKPWTFIGSNSPKDIYTRIATGIPGTQMPTFAKEGGKTYLPIEDRWHVANYVTSIATTTKAVAAENTVIKANRVEGEVPTDPNDPRWDESELSTFLFVPQIFAEKRVFTIANDTITASAFYNEQNISMLLQWDDRTNSKPGDPNSDKIADKVPYPDQVRVQLPVTIPKGTEKPYFIAGGEGNPVNLWQWTSPSMNTPEVAKLMNATGFANIEERDANASGLSMTSAYANGTWRVVMTRPLVTENVESDLQFEEGRFIPIAFSNWDGSNSEAGSHHGLSTWYWLLLKPDAGAKPIIFSLVVAGLILGFLLWWARGARRRDDA